MTRLFLLAAFVALFAISFYNCTKTSGAPAPAPAKKEAQPKVPPVPAVVQAVHVQGQWTMDWEGDDYNTTFAAGGFYQAIDLADGTVWTGNWQLDAAGKLTVNETCNPGGGGGITWDYDLKADKDFMRKLESDCGGLGLSR